MLRCIGKLSNRGLTNRKLSNRELRNRRPSTLLILIGTYGKGMLCKKIDPEGIRKSTAEYNNLPEDIIAKMKHT